MPDIDLPTAMRAVVKAADDIPLPQLQPNEVLIKVEYAALNPADWMSIDLFGKPGSIVGSDFSGTIAAVGAEPKKQWAIGDRVAGCIKGSLEPGRGTFAGYTKADSDRVFAVPDSLPLEQAAAFGIPLYTALHAVLHVQRADWPPAQVAGGPWYLINGASSAVGLFALQLAKLIGYRPIAICSPRNFDLVRSYGAEAVFDYADPAETIKSITKLTGAGVVIGVDTVSLDPSTLALQAFRPGAEGKVTILNALFPAGVKDGVDVKPINVFTLFGEDVDFGGGLTFAANEKDGQFGLEATARAPTLITQYGVKAAPLDIRDDFDAIPGGLDDLKAGKVSGKRIVLKLA